MAGRDKKVPASPGTSRRSVDPPSRRPSLLQLPSPQMRRFTSPYSTRSESPVRTLRNGKQQRLGNTTMLDGIPIAKKRTRSVISDCDTQSLFNDTASLAGDFQAPDSPMSLFSLPFTPRRRSRNQNSESCSVVSMPVTTPKQKRNDILASLSMPSPKQKRLDILASLSMPSPKQKRDDILASLRMPSPKQKRDDILASLRMPSPPKPRATKKVEPEKKEGKKRGNKSPEVEAPKKVRKNAKKVDTLPIVCKKEAKTKTIKNIVAKRKKLLVSHSLLANGKMRKTKQILAKKYCKNTRGKVLRETALKKANIVKKRKKKEVATEQLTSVQRRKLQSILLDGMDINSLKASRKAEMQDASTSTTPRRKLDVAKKSEPVTETPNVEASESEISKTDSEAIEKKVEEATTTKVVKKPGVVGRPKMVLTTNTDGDIVEKKVENSTTTKLVKKPGVGGRPKMVKRLVKKKLLRTEIVEAIQALPGKQGKKTEDVKPSVSNEDGETLNTLTQVSNILQQIVAEPKPSEEKPTLNDGVLSDAKSLVSDTPRSGVRTPKPLVTEEEECENKTPPDPENENKTPKLLESETKTPPPSSPKITNTLQPSEMNGNEPQKDGSHVSPINSLASKLRRKLSQSPGITAPMEPRIVGGKVVLPIINSLSAAAKQTSSFLNCNDNSGPVTRRETQWKVNKKLIYSKIKPSKQNGGKVNQALKGKVNSLLHKRSQISPRHVQVIGALPAPREGSVVPEQTKIDAVSDLDSSSEMLHEASLPSLNSEAKQNEINSLDVSKQDSSMDVSLEMPEVSSEKANKSVDEAEASSPVIKSTAEALFDALKIKSTPEPVTRVKRVMDTAVKSNNSTEISSESAPETDSKSTEVTLKAKSLPESGSKAAETSSKSDSLLDSAIKTTETNSKTKSMPNSVSKAVQVTAKSKNLQVSASKTTTFTPKGKSTLNTISKTTEATTEDKSTLDPGSKVTEVGSKSKRLIDSSSKTAEVTPKGKSTLDSVSKSTEVGSKSKSLVGSSPKKTAVTPKGKSLLDAVAKARSLTEANLKAKEKSATEASPKPKSLLDSGLKTKNATEASSKSILDSASKTKSLLDSGSKRKNSNEASSKSILDSVSKKKSLLESERTDSTEASSSKSILDTSPGDKNTTGVSSESLSETQQNEVNLDSNENQVSEIIPEVHSIQDKTEAEMFLENNVTESDSSNSTTEEPIKAPTVLFEGEDLVAKASVLGALGLQSNQALSEQAKAPKVPKLRLVCRPTHKKHRRSDPSAPNYKEKTYTVCREGDSLGDWDLSPPKVVRDPTLDPCSRSLLWYPRMPISNGKALETLVEVNVAEQPGVGVGDGQNGDNIDGGEKSSEPLVIPEKSSSFAIHPGRLCEDVCCYCHNKFGLYDTPLHVAQLKGEDKQRAVLAREPLLTLESCLCDACFRHLDRPGPPRCPKPAATKTRAQPNEVCCFNGCSQPAVHPLMRKWKRRVRTMLRREPQDGKAWTCDKHYSQLARVSECGMCLRRSSSQSMYKLEETAAPRLNRLLGCDSIPVTLDGESYLCKKCRYYASLRLRCEETWQLNSSNKLFLNEHRTKVLKVLNVDPSSVEELFKESEKPKKQAKRKSTATPEATPEVTPVPSPATPVVDSPKPAKQVRIKLATPTGNPRVKNTPSAKASNTVARTSAQKQGELRRVATLNASSTTPVSRPVTSTVTTPTLARNSNGLPNVSRHVTVSRVPSRSKPNTSSSSSLVSNDTSDPYSFVVSPPPPPQEFPSTAEVGMNSSFEFQPLEPNSMWQKVNATFQFDKKTRGLWHQLHAPYGSYTSFLRHLVLLETHWRNGDLELAPNASPRARQYLGSVQNRIEAYEGVPTAPETSSNVPLILDVRSLAADKTGAWNV